MDQLDLAIFRSLGVLPYGQDAGDLSRLNPWVIAKKVGVDGSTVKLRLKKMKESGFINYFQIYPNFRLLNISGAAYLFDVADIAEKDEVIRKVSLVDGITEIHNFIGPTLCIDFTFLEESDEARKLELLKGLTGCSSPEKYYERVMPAAGITLSDTDWKIIRALRYNAFRPLSEVAAELRVTLKTVRRRFERMARNNAIIVVPVVNPAQIANVITYTVLLHPSPEKWKSVLPEVMEVFKRSYFMTRISPPENAVIHASARTLAETEDNLIRVRKIDGMKDARVLILREIREFTEWLDSMIELKIRGTP